MTGYLLDNNHLGAAIARVSTVRERIYQLQRVGHRVGTCIPVLCELEVGIQQTADPEAYRRRLEHLLQQVRLWPIDQSLMLAALARSMNLILVTSDRDFEALPDLRTENWLVGT